MLNLVAALLCSSAVSVFMRISGRYVKNNMAMFAANYITCSFLSLLFLLGGHGPEIAVINGSGRGTAILLGVCTGGLYLGSFMLLQYNIQKNGVVLAATFMKLGVLVPIFMAALLGWEHPKMLQILGCVLTVAAIILINGEGNREENKGNHTLWLALQLLVSGLGESMINIYDKTGDPVWKNLFLLCIFFAAFLISIMMIFVKKQHFTPADALWGVLIGIPNYFSSRFLLHSLADVPAIVAYPVYNIGAIFIISLFGFLVFREKLSRRKLIGMGMILAAILAVNL